MTNVKNTAYINTPIGVTPNIQLPKIVQQGGVWGPLECSNSVDKIGRNCNSRGINYYKYKKVVNILPLAMVDDLCAISVCGNDSVCVNSYMETHINMKKLKFHTPDLKGKSKCHQLHIGKENIFCPKLKVHGTVMEKVNFDTYLGDIISKDGLNNLNIMNRVSRVNGIIAQIMNILDTVAFGPNYFKIALMLRKSLLISSVLTNCEVWFGLSDQDIKNLKNIIIMFLENFLAFHILYQH